MYYNDKETRLITDVFAVIAQQLREQEPEQGNARPYTVNVRLRLTDEDKLIAESLIYES